MQRIKRRLKKVFDIQTLKKAATSLLLFSFVFSPLVSSAQALEGAGGSSGQPEQSENIAQDSGNDSNQVIIPVILGDEPNQPPGFYDINDEPSTSPPSEDTDGEQTDTLPEETTPVDEEQPEIPEAQAMSGTSATEAGSLFINTDTTRSATPDVDTQTGSLSYSYNLTVPPGRLSMTPDLKLRYSSNEADNTNLYGYGWTDSIPYIKRANKKGIESIYALNDFYSSLDGELVPVVGSTTAYQPRTENGSFRKYTFASSTWTVIDKDGTTFTFGSTSAARRDNPITAKDPTGRMFGIDDAAGFLGGGLIAVTSQALVSLITSTPVSSSERAQAFVTGGIIGVGAVNTPETLGASNAVSASIVTGLTAGFYGEATKQGIDIATGKQTGVNYGDIQKTSLETAALNGFLQKGLPEAKIPGVTAGRNSMKAVAESARTKGVNGTISNISWTTASKSAVASQAGDLFRILGEGLYNTGKTTYNNQSKSP